ncbi:amidohydrolase [Candidatus Poribacteria bacterium]|nr:amidohydrolase [Candidatus Poribacteria bacterium]
MNDIDAHVHVWTDDLERYPIADPFRKTDMKPETFRPDELLAHARPSGVNRFVLVQMSFYGFDNSYMLDIMEQHPGVFSGIAVIDWNGERPDEEMHHLTLRGVRGFRVYPKNAPIESWLDGRGFERMFATGGEDNLAICPLINPDALPALDKRCEQFPQTPVIIDHLCRIGASQPIRETHIDQLCAMARHPNVMVKVSAFYALGKKTPPYDDLKGLIQRVYEAFGPKRLMWASDCPYQVVNQTYEDSIGLIRERLDFLSEADKNQILRKTAEDFFFKAH